MKVKKEKTVKFTVELDALELLIIRTLLGSISGLGDFRTKCDEMYYTFNKHCNNVGTLIGQSIDGDKVKLNNFIKEAEKM